MKNVVPAAGDGAPSAPKQAFEERPADGTADGPLVPITDAIGMSPFAFHVPPTVYGAAALIGVLDEFESWLDWMEKAGEVYGMLFMNVVAQAFLLVALWQLVRWQEDVIQANEECYRLFGPVLALCLWMFFCAIMTEISETIYLAEIVAFQVPTVEGGSQCLKYLATHDGPVLKSGGMSRARKGCTMSFVVLPKLFLGLVMFVVGGWFLSHSSSNLDLFMNSLAAVFIVETDEMIFNFFTPGSIRRLVEELPPFETGGAPRHHMFRRIMFISRFAVSGIATAMFFAMRSDCMRDPCEDSFATCPVLPILR